MYVSNQTRQRRYKKLRADEEENAINQQEVLDKEIAKDKSLDVQAAYFNKFTSRLAKNLRDEELKKVINNPSIENIPLDATLKDLEDKSISYKKDSILLAIKGGYLDKLIEDIKKIPDGAILTKKERIIVNDLKNGNVPLDSLNADFADIEANIKDPIEKAKVIKGVLGDYLEGNSSAKTLDQLAMKVSKNNKKKLTNEEILGKYKQSSPTVKRNIANESIIGQINESGSEKGKKLVKNIIANQRERDINKIQSLEDKPSASQARSPPSPTPSTASTVNMSDDALMSLVSAANKDQLLNILKNSNTFSIDQLNLILQNSNLLKGITTPTTKNVKRFAKNLRTFLQENR